MHGGSGSGGARTRPSRRHLLTDRGVAAMPGLGFGSGIPFLLVYGTSASFAEAVTGLAAEMMRKQESKQNCAMQFCSAGVAVRGEVPLGTPGLMSEPTLADKVKFVWAPFLDQCDAPLLGRWPGRRRGRIIASQSGVMLTLAGVAFGDPAHGLAWTAVFPLAPGFAGPGRTSSSAGGASPSRPPRGTP